MRSAEPRRKYWQAVQGTVWLTWLYVPFGSVLNIFMQSPDAEKPLVTRRDQRLFLAPRLGEDGYANETFALTRRRRIAPPTMPMPPIIIAQVAGSGTAPASEAENVRFVAVLMYAVPLSVTNA